MNTFVLEEALVAVDERGASDLHLSVGARPRLRIDGDLRDMPEEFPLFTDESLRASLLPILDDRKREKYLATGEMDFAHSVTDKLRFRVNYYRQRGRMGAAFRIIPNEVKPLASLGLDERIASFAHLPRGLVLVTGPTGSGKSTTLASLIDVANANRDAHIVTVEDPIEFTHEHKRSIITQRQIGEDTESFGEALRRVLRQDPDIILIGELRDAESVSVALTAAETGHLVFGTLHTRDAAQSIDRIIDTYPPAQQSQVRAQLAGALQGIVSQTLVKKISGGRAVATEVLRMTPGIAHMLREGKSHQVPSSLQGGGAIGMHTMDQDLARLVKQGVISKAVALEKVTDENLFETLLNGNEGGGNGNGLSGKEHMSDVSDLLGGAQLITRRSVHHR